MQVQKQDNLELYRTPHKIITCEVLRLFQSWLQSACCDMILATVSPIRRCCSTQARRLLEIRGASAARVF